MELQNVVESVSPQVKEGLAMGLKGVSRDGLGLDEGKFEGIIRDGAHK